MNSIKRSFLTTLLFSICLIFNAQDFQGKAYYKSKTSVDLDQWGGDKMSAERKKMIMERMKNFLEKEYVLTFNKTESIYKEEEKLEAPGSRGWGGFASSFTAGPQYKSVKNKSLIQESRIFWQTIFNHRQP